MKVQSGEGEQGKPKIKGTLRSHRQAIIFGERTPQTTLTPQKQESRDPDQSGASCEVDPSVCPRAIQGHEDVVGAGHSAVHGIMFCSTSRSIIARHRPIQTYLAECRGDMKVSLGRDQGFGPGSVTLG